MILELIKEYENWICVILIASLNANHVYTLFSLAFLSTYEYTFSVSKFLFQKINKDFLFFSDT